VCNLGVTAAGLVDATRAPSFGGQGLAGSSRRRFAWISALSDRCLCPMSQGVYKYHQYQVVGRHVPTEKEPEPTVYRMKLWATDPVRARSKFWCAFGDETVSMRHLLLHHSIIHTLP
jgi:hypothetical protein